MKIFISIASYQDPLLLETLSSAYVKAKFPKNLRFGVLDQSDFPIDPNKLKIRNQLSFEHVAPSESKGPCWARRRIQNYVNDEDYYLQVDSHTLFQQDWDELIIKYHGWVEEFHDHEFIFSGYPRSFKVPKDFNPKKDTYKINVTHKDTLGIAFREKRFFEDGHYSMQKSVKAHSFAPVKGVLVGGGFIFGRINFVKTIPYDEKLYFHGEELNIALRLYTNGWDVVHIPRVPLFHLYTDVNNLIRKLHWNPEDDSLRTKKWHELDKDSKARLSYIIEGKIEGEYGLGKTRDLKSFSEKVGIDILNKEVVDQEGAISGKWLKEIKGKRDFKEVEFNNK